MRSRLRPLLIWMSCVGFALFAVLQAQRQSAQGEASLTHHALLSRVNQLVALAEGRLKNEGSLGEPLLAVSEYRQKGFRYELVKRTIASKRVSESDFVGIDERSGLNFTSVQQSTLSGTVLKNGVSVARLALRVSDQLVRVAEVGLDSIQEELLSLAGPRTAWTSLEGVVLASNSPETYKDMQSMRDSSLFQSREARSPLRHSMRHSWILTEAPVAIPTDWIVTYGVGALLFFLGLTLVQISGTLGYRMGTEVPLVSQAPRPREARAKSQSKPKSKAKPAPAPEPEPVNEPEPEPEPEMEREEVRHAEPAVEPAASSPVVVQLVSLLGDASPDFEESVASWVHGKGGSFSRASDDSWVIAWGLIAPSPDDGDNALACAEEIRKLTPKGVQARILLHFTEIEGSDIGAAVSRELLPEVGAISTGTLFVTEAFNRLVPGKVKASPIKEDSKIFRVNDPETKKKPAQPKPPKPPKEITIKTEKPPVDYASFAKEAETSTASMARDPTASKALERTDFSKLSQRPAKPAQPAPVEITLTGRITEEVDLTKIPDFEIEISQEEEKPADSPKDGEAESPSPQSDDEDAA